jgi:hypothetical protein
MPSSPRLTIRLSPDLAARVAAHVGHGRSMSDIVRQALEGYLGGVSSPGPTRPTPASDPPLPLADTLSDIHARLTAIEQQLAAIEQQLAAIDAVSATVRQRQPPRPTPPPGAYDPAAAVARMQALQAQGLSLRQIATQLNAEEVPTHRGGPWGPSAVRYLLKTSGQ